MWLNKLETKRIGSTDSDISSTSDFAFYASFSGAIRAVAFLLNERSFSHWRWCRWCGYIRLQFESLQHITLRTATLIHGSFSSFSTLLSKMPIISQPRSMYRYRATVGPTARSVRVHVAAPGMPELSSDPPVQDKGQKNFFTDDLRSVFQVRVPLYRAHMCCLCLQ